MFALTNDQQYIADILDEARFLRADQVYGFLQKISVEKDREYSNRVISQLQNLNRACRIGDNLITLPHLRQKPVDNEMLMAIDALLDLSDTAPPAIVRAKYPLKLRFLAERGELIVPFVVAVVDRGSLELLYTRIQNVDKGVTFVFLLENIQDSTLIRTEHTHFFAAYDNSKLQYFKGASE